MDYDVLDQDAARLFLVAGAWAVRSIKLTGDEKDRVGYEIEHIEDLSVLERSIEKDYSREIARAFIIRQQNSWGRFRISLEGFKAILNFYKPTISLDSFVRAFGFKCLNSDEDFGGYDRHIGANVAGQIVHELCYNLRYIEKIDRDGEYPWVFRQVALYHQQNADLIPKIILLQPPKKLADYVMERLEATTSYIDQKKGVTNHVDLLFAIDLMALRLAEQNWRPFLNHIEAEYNIYVSTWILWLE
ncbi:hypothetical protein ABW20_dc0101511 [Dactylellina cionopaga]|nr:hypothetical protein ABW20_dc0101511 [Dactylellina cionopaga]